MNASLALTMIFRRDRSPRKRTIRVDLCGKINRSMCRAGLFQTLGPIAEIDPGRKFPGLKQSLSLKFFDAGIVNTIRRLIERAEHFDFLARKLLGAGLILQAINLFSGTEDSFSASADAGLCT